MQDEQVFVTTAAADFHLRVLAPKCELCGISDTGTAMQLERRGWQLIDGTVCPGHRQGYAGCIHGCADYDTHQTIFGGGHSEFPD